MVLHRRASGRQWRGLQFESLFDVHTFCTKHNIDVPESAMADWSSLSGHPDYVEGFFQQVGQDIYKAADVNMILCKAREIELLFVSVSDVAQCVPYREWFPSCLTRLRSSLRGGHARGRLEELLLGKVLDVNSIMK